MDAIILPCTQEKVWDGQLTSGSVPAKDAYAKPAFRVWRSYAERSGCAWFLLSTKYGLIPPEQLIDKYNVPVSSALSNAAFLRLLAAQGKELGISGFDRLILLIGSDSNPWLRPHWAKRM